MKEKNGEIDDDDEDFEDDYNKSEQENKEN